MRRRTWLATLAAALLAGWAVPALAQGGVRPPVKPVTVVNGVTISPSELEAVLKLAGTEPVHLPESQRRQRQMEALSMLIDNILWHQYLEKNTPPVSPAEVGKRLAEMEAGLKAQGKSLAEFCHDTNQTPEQLRICIADHLRWAASLQQSVSEAQVEQYYRDNKDFFDEVTVKASHIVLRVPAGASDKEKKDTLERLTQIRAQLASDPKADFAELAKKHSQDPRAAQGGDLGYFPRKWVFDEAFSKAAFSLTVGQVSEIVQTDFGLHLIKVTDRKPGKVSDYSKIKEAVREFYAEDRRQELLAAERKAARIEPINLP
jgi:peptidyl-prolyl cis-trans isomerase C